MKLRLVIEQSPGPQGQMERIFDGGQMSIGRSGDADWQLDDPEMFVSRRHCILSEDGGEVRVTDASSGGLYIDNGSSPLGTGNSVPVEPGMRLRLGDFTILIEDPAEPEQAPASPVHAPGAGAGLSFDFGQSPETPETPPERPSSLPDPFGLRQDGEALDWDKKEEKRPPRPLDQDDPFGLDLNAGMGRAQGVPEPEPAAPQTPPRVSADFSSGSYFDKTEGAGVQTPPTPSSPPPGGKDLFADWSAEPVEPPQRPDVSVPPVQQPPGAQRRAPEPSTPPRAPSGLGTDEPDSRTLRIDLSEINASPATPDRPAPSQRPPDAALGSAEFGFGAAPEEPSRAAPPVAESQPSAPPRQTAAPPQRPATSGDAAMRDALFQAMGLDPAQFTSGDPQADVEQVGRCMRDLVEGVMLLLRTRAQERQKVRVAQTIIASTDVNPLKFLATTEDALGALVQPRGKGYLGPEAALRGAFRDLTDHQVRTWAALQTALRRMVDKFDPKEIEKEMDDIGLLESLIAGGRSAKLWQLYADRYKEIAESAEEQFLGEVGSDFRNAYESQRRG